MLGSLPAFVTELREIGVPVSMVEAIDAAKGLRHVDLGDREALRATLGATLIKNHRHRNAFDVAFDVFFGLQPRHRPDDAIEADDNDPSARNAVGSGAGSRPGSEGEGVRSAGDEALFEAFVDALRAGDANLLRQLVAKAVDRYGGIEPGRPVGGRYYLYRVMRRLDASRMLRRLEADQASASDVLDKRLVRAEAAERVDQLQAEVRREILRRLVADRGAPIVARTLREALVEDIDLMHTTAEELARIERAVAPLARKLATRLAQKRKRGSKGRLDVRRTIRRSLAHGGALVDPRFKPPRRSKPELVLLSDISGSMATFSRFTMQLTHAMGHQFSSMRTFAFVDAVDEVTRFFGQGADLRQGLAAMGETARVIGRDGHSDYGNALQMLGEIFPGAVTPRSTVIITGDARNNYRPPNLDALASFAGPARALFWLNPEARRYWDTGDSIMSVYEPICDGVYEVRSLRQLEEFVERIVLPVGGRRPVSRLS